jgi:hypothetical protein
MALGCFDVEFDLLVFGMFEFRSGVSLVCGRHLGIGKGDGKRAENGGEFLVQLARSQIAHLDKIAVVMLADLVTPVPAFGCTHQHRNLHSTELLSQCYSRRRGSKRIPS